MNIRIIDNLESFKALEKSWSGFVSECINDDFFVSHTWLNNCVKFLKPSDSLKLLLFEDNEKIIGAAPLGIQKGVVQTPGNWKIPVPVKKFHFIGDRLSPRCDFPITGDSESIMNSIADYLSANVSSWEMIEFRQVPESSPNFPFIEKSFGRHGFTVRITNDSLCPYRTFGNSYKKKNPAGRYASSSRLERQINKGLRELKVKGRVEFRVFQDYDLDNIGADVAEIENESWKRGEKHRLFSRSSAQFTSDLFFSATRSGHLFVIILYLDNSPIAYNVGFIYRQKYYSYSAAYKEEYARFKPGYILHRETLKIMEGMILREHDFLMGGDRYKQSFCNRIRQNRIIRIFNDHPASRILHGIFDCGEPLYRQLKRSLYGPPYNGRRRKHR